MPLNTEPYIDLLMQAPLVGGFIWFALKVIGLFTTSMEQRDQAWREFLDQQRQATNAVIGRFAEEIKALSREIAELRGALK